MSSPPSAPDAAEGTLERGVWKHPEVTDLRGPCPIINSLANHGYIPRDGRNVTADNLIKVFEEVLGMAPDAAIGLTKPVFLLHTKQEPDKVESDSKAPENTSWFHGYFKLPSLPTIDSESTIGLRNAGQVNSAGTPVLNIDQLSRHGAIEHDVSLSRNDAAQGDNTSPQPHLLDQLFNSPADGKIFTIADFARLRNKRLEQQKKDNPELNFGIREAILAFGEVALVMCVWGVSVAGGYDRLPLEYVKAIFGQERIPFEEGWKTRKIPITLAEVTANSTYLQGAAFLDSFRQ